MPGGDYTQRGSNTWLLQHTTHPKAALFKVHGQFLRAYCPILYLLSESLCLQFLSFAESVLCKEFQRFEVCCSLVEIVRMDGTSSGTSTSCGARAGAGAPDCKLGTPLSCYALDSRERQIEFKTRLCYGHENSSIIYH